MFFFFVCIIVALFQLVPPVVWDFALSPAEQSCIHVLFSHINLDRGKMERRRQRCLQIGRLHIGHRALRGRTAAQRWVPERVSVQPQPGETESVLPNEAALRDAESCVRIAPSWKKGQQRLKQVRKEIARKGIILRKPSANSNSNSSKPRREKAAASGRTPPPAKAKTQTKETSHHSNPAAQTTTPDSYNRLRTHAEILRLSDKGDFAGAVKYGLCALDILRARHGKHSGHPHMQDVLVELSQVHILCGRFQYAAKALSEAIEMANKHPIPADVLASRVKECQAMKKIAANTKNWVRGGISAHSSECCVPWQCCHCHCQCQCQLCGRLRCCATCMRNTVSVKITQH